MARDNSKMWMLFAGAAAGTAAWYFLDHSQGPHRRAAFGRSAKRLQDAVSKSMLDAHHRVTGTARGFWSDISSGPPDDRILVERVRSRLGRIVAHPSEIHVASDNGVITLWGMATTEEARQLLHAVKALRGVKEVLNHLELQDKAEPATPEPCPISQARHKTLLNWSPAKRMLVGTAGIAAAAYGLRRKSVLGYSLALAGAGAIAASTMKNNVRSMLAFAEDAPGFELEETIRINAPISDLYDFWVNPENYPRVFTHISSLERLGENLYRWTITGPAGIPVQWDGMITRAVPNTIVEWKSLPGSTVGNFGVARFDPNYDASTRLQIRMFYRPPGGLLGCILAGLFGADPKNVLHEDLQRLKQRFEKDAGLMKELRDGNWADELLNLAKT